MSEQYKVISLNASDAERVEQFLIKEYFPDDPVLIAMGISEADDDQIKHILQFLKESYSYGAVNSEGELLGVLLCGTVHTRDTSSLMEEKKNCKSEYFSKLIDFYIETSRGQCLWKITGEEKALETHIASVKRTARRKGIMRRLFDRAIQDAEKDFNLIVCTCASKYTMHLCQSLGWECVYCLPYCYFKDSQGQPLFPTPEEPHLHTRLYIHQSKSQKQ